MRIAMISEHASPLVAAGVDAGGQNVYVAQLAEALGRLGHAVDVFTRRDELRAPEVEAPWPGVRVFRVPAGPAAFVRKEELLPHMRAFAEWTRRACERTRYDLAHANFWMSGLVACELKRALALPFVATFHALGRVRLLHHGAADGFPRERVLVEQRVVDEADRLVAECPQDREDLVNLYRAEPGRVAMLPCGYDPREMSPVPQEEARRETGLPERGRLLLQLGRLVPRKGIDNAVRALGRLVHEHGLEARLVVVGGESDAPDPAATPEIGRLVRVARSERVEELVVFAGRRRREELKSYYAACDAFITTPWYEPFGMTALEAMACGRPVLGSAVGGIKYTVRDGQTGFLVPPNDPGALAEKLALLYRQPWRAALMGWRARRRATRFTWDRIAEGAAALYQEVAERARPAGGVPR